MKYFKFPCFFILIFFFLDIHKISKNIFPIFYQINIDLILNKKKVRNFNLKKN